MPDALGKVGRVAPRAPFVMVDNRRQPMIGNRCVTGIGTRCARCRVSVLPLLERRATFRSLQRLLEPNRSLRRAYSLSASDGERAGSFARRSGRRWRSRMRVVGIELILRVRCLIY